MRTIGDEIFPHTDWTAYIPEYRIHSRVITKDIDNTELPEEIIGNLRSPPNWKGDRAKPVNAKCIRRKVTDSEDPSKTYFKNTNLYLVTFNCIRAPSSATYLGKKSRFVPYVHKVKRCFTCQRFGHLENQCRGGKKARISGKCATVGHSAAECTSSNIQCINCIRKKFKTIGHSASDLNCPTYIECRKVKVIMAKLGLSPGWILRLFFCSRAIAWVTTGLTLIQVDLPIYPHLQILLLGILLKSTMLTLVTKKRLLTTTTHRMRTYPGMSQIEVPGTPHWVTFPRSQHANLIEYVDAKG